MNALDIYKPPFKTEDGFTIHSSNEIMAMMSVYNGRHSEALTHKLVAILNDEAKPALNCKLTYDAPNICINGSPFMVIRGWSYLTAENGLNLDAETACRIQDEFAAHVISKMTDDAVFA